MDRTGARHITLETFLDHFHVQAYPDVANGVKTEWKALREIEDFFLYCAHGVSVCLLSPRSSSSHSSLPQNGGGSMEAVIEAETFEMFFRNLSPGYDSDEEFFAIVRQMTGLSDKKPSVQMKPSRGKSGHVRAPSPSSSLSLPAPLCRSPSPSNPSAT
jgi:hypothetical protein